MLRPFFIAVQFLTRIPLPSSGIPAERDIGRSLLFYPLVGLLIGALLVMLDHFIAHVSPALRAALLLAAWVMLTGGLHLDGLADSADAWAGGLGNRERTLAIMKDPCCGPSGVVALVLVLLVKFAALQTVIFQGNGLALAVVPALARTALPALFLSTPYVRPGGLGSALASHLPRHAAGGVIAVVVAALLLALAWRGLTLLLVALGVFIALRFLMLRRIGGTTGDTAGALVELVETAALVALCIRT